MRASAPNVNRQSVFRKREVETRLQRCVADAVRRFVSPQRVGMSYTTALEEPTTHVGVFPGAVDVHWETQIRERRGMSKDAQSSNRADL